VKKNPVIQEKLKWLVPGAVWSLDYTYAPGMIEEIGPTALSVRDLSSGAQLLWTPTVTQESPECVWLLQELYDRWGAPLALKADGGPAFHAEDFLAFQRRWGVKLLVSPPYHPPYNGSVESGNRWMKLRTNHQACLRGCRGDWSVADMEKAQRIANEFTTSPVDRTRSPQEVWESREPVSDETRRAFLDRVKDEQVRARVELGLLGSRELTARQRAEVERTAIRRALVAHGILQYRRRRVSLPFHSRKAARIS
jgi:hypothetical protein